MDKQASIPIVNHVVRDSPGRGNSMDNTGNVVGGHQKASNPSSTFQREREKDRPLRLNFDEIILRQETHCFQSLGLKISREGILIR